MQNWCVLEIYFWTFNLCIICLNLFTVFMNRHSPQGTSVYNDYCLRPETYSYEAFARLANHFSHNEAAAADWLTRLKETPPDTGHVTCQMTSLVASILVVSNALRISLLALEVLAVIAGQAPTQVRGFAKFKLLKKYKIKLDRAHSTHLPPSKFFWKPITE